MVSGGQLASFDLALRLKDEASDKLKDIAGNMSKFGVIAAGAAVAGIAGMAALAKGLLECGKAAAEEEVSLSRLSAAITASGGNWDKARASVEEFSSQARQLAFDDTALQESLSQLTTITGDYNKATSLLPLSMDLARAKGMDLASAAQLVGRVAQGSTGMLSRYGIVIKEGASATEALAMMQQRFGGQAQAYASTYQGAMGVLANQFNEIKEVIGGAVLPIMTTVALAFGKFATDSLPKVEAAVAMAMPKITEFVGVLAEKLPAAFTSMRELEPIIMRVAKAMVDFATGSVTLYKGIDDLVTKARDMHVEMAGQPDMWGLNAAAVKEMEASFVPLLYTVKEAVYTVKEASVDISVALGQTAVPAYDAMSQQAAYNMGAISDAAAKNAQFTTEAWTKATDKLKSDLGSSFSSMSESSRSYYQQAAQSSSNYQLQQLQGQQQYNMNVARETQTFQQNLAAAQASGNQQQIQQLTASHAQRLAEMGRDYKVQDVMAEQNRKIEQAKQRLAHSQELFEMRRQLMQKTLIWMQENQMRLGFSNAELAEVSQYMAAKYQITVGIEAQTTKDVQQILEARMRGEAITTKEILQQVEARVKGFQEEVESYQSIAGGGALQIDWSAFVPPTIAIPELPPMPTFDFGGGGGAAARETQTNVEALDETVGRIADAIGGAIQTLKDIADYSKLDITAGVQALADNMEEMIVILIHTAWKFGDAKNDWRDIPKAAAEFAQWAASTVGAFGQAAQSIKEIADYELADITQGMANIVVNLLIIIQSANSMVERIKAINEKWQDYMKDIANFSKYVQESIGFIKPAVDAIKSAAEYKAAAGLAEKMDALLVDLQAIMAAFTDKLPTMLDESKELLTKLTAWADRIKPATEIIKSVSDIAKTLAANAKDLATYATLGYQGLVDLIKKTIIPLVQAVVDALDELDAITLTEGKDPVSEKLKGWAERMKSVAPIISDTAKAIQSLIDVSKDLKKYAGMSVEETAKGLQEGLLVVLRGIMMAFKTLTPAAEDVVVETDGWTKTFTIWANRMKGVASIIADTAKSAEILIDSSKAIAIFAKFTPAQIADLLVTGILAVARGIMMAFKTLTPAAEDVIAEADGWTKTFTIWMNRMKGITSVITDTAKIAETLVNQAKTLGKLAGMSVERVRDMIVGGILVIARGIMAAFKTLAPIGQEGPADTDSWVKTFAVWAERFKGISAVVEDTFKVADILVNQFKTWSKLGGMSAEQIKDIIVNGILNIARGIMMAFKTLTPIGQEGTADEDAWAKTFATWAARMKGISDIIDSTFGIAEKIIDGMKGLQGLWKRFSDISGWATGGTGGAGTPGTAGGVPAPGWTQAMWNLKEWLKEQMIPVLRAIMTAFQEALPLIEPDGELGKSLAEWQKNMGSILGTIQSAVDIAGLTKGGWKPIRGATINAMIDNIVWIAEQFAAGFDRIAAMPELAEVKAKGVAIVKELIDSTIGVAQGLQEMSWRRVNKGQVDAFLKNLQNVMYWLQGKDENGVDVGGGLPSIVAFDASVYVQPIADIRSVVFDLVESIKEIQTLPLIGTDKMGNITMTITNFLGAMQNAIAGKLESWSATWKQLRDKIDLHFTNLPSDMAKLAIAAIEAVIEAFKIADTNNSLYNAGLTAGAAIRAGFYAGLGTLTVGVYFPPPGGGGASGSGGDITAQHGFHGWVKKPTRFLAGERGKEYVSITPKNRMAGGGMVVSGPLLAIENFNASGNMDYDVNELTDAIVDAANKRLGGRIKNRTYLGGR